MTEKTTTEILICGAGAAGLTLAIDLARRNVPFRLIEKMDTPFSGSRGKGIQPRSQEVFEDLGIIDCLVATGGKYPPQRKYRDDGSFEDSVFIESEDATPAEPYHIPLLVPQFLTERVMRDRLAELGQYPEYGHELTGFDQDAEGITSYVTGPAGVEIIRTRYLVGADGGRSFVRHALDISFPGKTLGVRAIVADVLLEGLSRDAWHRFNEGSIEGSMAKQQISFCPLAGTEMFQLQAPIPLEGEIDVAVEGLTAMVAARTGRTDIVIRSVFWASVFNMNARLADRYRVGRVFLTGDAAHIHPPTGAQGLNTSVQDAYNLGWKLAAVLDGAPSALLDTYEEERRPIAAQVLGLATKLLDTPNKCRTRQLHQLDIGYPDSSLAMEKPERQDGIFAGDRAPDAPVRGAAGQPTRLFRLFEGPHWTLLGYEIEGPPAIASCAGLHIHAVGLDGDIVDNDHHMQDAYGVKPGDWVLVRPDGYIGAIVALNETVALKSYLTAAGVQTIERAYT